VHKKRQFEPF